MRVYVLLLASMSRAVIEPNQLPTCGWSLVMRRCLMAAKRSKMRLLARKVDIRLPGKGIQIPRVQGWSSKTFSMMKWIRIRLSVKNSLFGRRSLIAANRSKMRLLWAVRV